jgi:hypothetical protein
MTMRELVDEAGRSADRIVGDDAMRSPAPLAEEIIRIARIATSLHLAESTRLAADADRRKRTIPTPIARESVR